VLKKTSACTGLAITTAAGALFTSSPAYAQAPAWGGGCCGSHHSSHFSRHHNRNWNGNHNRPRIFIRIYIYNKNTNHARAIVLPPRERRRADRVLRVPALGGDGAATGLTTAGPAVTRAGRRPAVTEVPADMDQAPTAADRPATDRSAANRPATDRPASDGSAAPAGAASPARDGKSAPRVHSLVGSSLYGGRSTPRDSILGGSLYGGDEEASDATPTA
jgi:hypothetical protein